MESVWSTFYLKPSGIQCLPQRLPRLKAVKPPKINNLPRWRVAVIMSCFLPAIPMTATAQVFTPFAFTDLLYSSNIDRQQDEQDAFVFDVGAGFELDYSTAKNEIIGNYDIRQLVYSDDSDKNTAFQNLDASWLYQTPLDGVSLFSDANIDNVARARDENAIADVVAGNTVQQIDVEAGVLYANPQTGVAFVNARGYYSLSEDEDNAFDNDAYGVSLYSEDGLDAKALFWVSDWSFDSRTGDLSGQSSEFVVLNQTLGVKTRWDIAPLARVNYEKINNEQDQEIETLFYGAGLRYQPDRNNYLEISYNIADDRDDEDYWGGEIRLQPTPRSFVFATYDRRFFGDAYTLAWEHRTKRLTNTLSYRETPVNYDRDSFVSGQAASDVQVVKQARWDGTLAGPRTTWRAYISHRDSESVDALALGQDGEDISFEYGAAVEHQLSRRTGASLSVDFDDLELFDITGTSQSQEDFYQSYSASLDHQISRSLNGGVELEYTTRDSDASTREYNEFRASVSLTMDF